MFNGPRRNYRGAQNGTSVLASFASASTDDVAQIAGSMRPVLSRRCRYVRLAVRVTGGPVCLVYLHAGCGRARGSEWRSCRRGRSRSCSPTSRVRRVCGRSIRTRCGRRWRAMTRSSATRSRAHDGHVVKTTGDGIHAVFATAHDALGRGRVDAAARSVPNRFSEGPVACTDGDPFLSRGVTRTATTRECGQPRGPDHAVAHGGQVVVSLVWSALVRDQPVELDRPGGSSAARLDQPERMYQVVHPDLPARSRRCARSTRSRGTCRCR